MQSSRKTEPISYLDCAIVRIAVRKARKLIAKGMPPDEALGLACPGAWAQWRGRVEAVVMDGL